MIRNITILGAGTMGRGIAHTFARHGYPVRLYEPFDAVRKAAPGLIEDELGFLVREDCLTAAQAKEALGRITLCADLADAAQNADYVLEVCPEQLELKKSLFVQLDRVCRPDTIFATNTSSLRLFDVIADLPPQRQGKCMVCHWYNPPYLLPIAELSKFGNMSEENFCQVKELYTNCGKRVISVLKDIPGMVANRLLHAQAREAFHLMEIGAASPEDIDCALMYGPCFRNATTGMLRVADMGGLDVWLAAEDNLLPALDNSGHACDALRRRVEQGDLGVKNGKGFYDYPEEERARITEDFYRRLLIQLRASEQY